MGLRTLFAIAAMSLVARASLIEDATEKTLASLLKKNEIILAAFTSTSLDSLQPFHDTLAQTADVVQTPFAVINCEEEEDLCEEHDVNTLPAIRLFRKAAEEGAERDMIRYRGRRTKNAIRSFLTKFEQPVLSHVQPEELPRFKRVDDIVVMAYLRPDQEALIKVFRAVASKHHETYVFGYVTDMSTADNEGLAMPSIVCYKNTDGDNKVLSGKFVEEDVERLLETVKENVIGEFSERNIETYMVRDKLTIYIFIPFSHEDAAIRIRHDLTPIAKKYSQYAIFAIADGIEYAPMAQSFGLSGQSLPSLAVHAPMNDHVFTYKQDRKIDGSTVDAMLMTVLQGKAVSGQVFGDDAPNLEAQDGGVTHDEL